MPYIDLNSPTNPGVNASSGNDLSGLPGPIVQTPVQTAQTVSGVTNPANPITQPVQPAKPVGNTGPTPMEDHDLLRNVPANLNSNPTSVTDGIKEFAGPVLGGIASTTVATQPMRADNDVSDLIPPPVAKVELPKQQPSVPVQPVVPQVSVQTVEQVASVGNLEINKYIDEVIAKGASDLHIAVGFPPTIRIDGRLVPITNKDLSASDVKSLLESMLSKKQKESLANDYDVDFSYAHRTGERFRVNIFWSKGTLAGAFRYIPSKIKTIADLGLPSVCYDLIKKPHGLILLTGPTGSGKSTSIAAMINEINMTESKHIVTIEDPVEYLFPRAKSIVNQRELGSDVVTWKRALRELLRQDPNVVVVGEMRDFETIAATITVAETGHLVFTTLHTNSASQTVDRIIDVFPEAQQSQVRAQLANVITAVIAQRLVPLQNGGRRAVFEVMTAIPAVKNAIREGKTYQIDNIIQTNLDQGMVTLEKSLVQLIRNGEITIETAKEFTNKPDELDALLTQN